MYSPKVDFVYGRSKETKSTVICSGKLFITTFNENSSDLSRFIKYGHYEQEKDLNLSTSIKHVRENIQKLSYTSNGQEEKVILT